MFNFPIRTRRPALALLALATVAIPFMQPNVQQVAAAPAAQAVGHTYVDEVFFRIPHLIYMDITGKTTDLGDLCPRSRNGLTWLFDGTLPEEWSPISGEYFPDDTPKVVYKYKGAEREFENANGGVIDTWKGVVILGGKVKVDELTYRCVSPTNAQRAAAFTEAVAALEVLDPVQPKPTAVPVPAAPTATPFVPPTAVPAAATPFMIPTSAPAAATPDTRPTVDPRPTPVPCYTDPIALNREVGGWANKWERLNPRDLANCTWKYLDKQSEPLQFRVPNDLYKIDYWDNGCGCSKTKDTPGDLPNKVDELTLKGKGTR